MAQKEQTKKTKKNTVKVTPNGKAFITCTYNNTIITVTNSLGEAVCWSSPGMVGFKGAKQSTPYAATLASEQVAKKAVDLGVQSIDIITKGPGNSKMSAIKGLKSGGLKVTTIRDVTPIPHNGCRPKKRRRM
ncbi:30S ribosomal protein S11 [bacterium]|nr:30S ribosomal protein S11 [bacterium]